MKPYVAVVMQTQGVGVSWDFQVAASPKDPEADFSEAGFQGTLVPTEQMYSRCRARRPMLPSAPRYRGSDSWRKHSVVP